jgi:hypothetical protein
MNVSVSLSSGVLKRSLVKGQDLNQKGMDSIGLLTL